MPKTLKVITLGCSKNKVDTEHLLAQVDKDFQILPEDSTQNCDYLLLNTCGFIGDSKEESIQAILEAGQQKSRGEIKKLIVFGCLSQRYMDSLPSLMPEVDAWYGARDLEPIIKDLTGHGSKGDYETRYITNPKAGYAYFKISEGCNRRCSYCAIPFIRGNHRSVPIPTLVAEAERLAQTGIKELIIIAQDTTFYGLDLYKKRALADLLDALSKVNGIEWLRIHYSYPADFPEDVLEQMANNPKVCKYMDIPLQHIADSVLDKMHRNVSSAWTKKLISTMREKVPGIAIRTTMIVGHPGEGKKEFQELLDFVKEAKFERLGAFTYSEEEGTYGAKNFKDSISKKTKQERYNALMELQNSISFENNTKRVGSQEKVIVDDFVNGNLICRSQYESPEVDGEILVKYDKEQFANIPPTALIGKFINVVITGADDYDLTAQLKSL